MKRVAILTTYRKDIARIMHIPVRSDMDLSDAGVLRGNMARKEIFTYEPQENTIKFIGGGEGDTVEFKFTEEGIDIDVQGRVLNGARMFLKAVSELQNEFMLVEKR